MYKKVLTKRNLIYLSVLLFTIVVLFFIPIRSFGQVNVTFMKKQAIKSRLYWDKGEGFSEDASNGKSVQKKRTIKFKIDKENYPLQAIRFDPVEGQSELDLLIEEISIYGIDGLKREYKGVELESVLSPLKDIDGVVFDEEGCHFRVSGNDSQFGLNPAAIAELNSSMKQPKAIKCAILFLVLLFEILCFNRKYIFQYLSRPRNVSTLLLSVIGGALLFKIIYSRYVQNEGFYANLVVMAYLSLLTVTCYFCFHKKCVKYPVLFGIQIWIVVHILFEMVFSVNLLSNKIPLDSAQMLLAGLAMLSMLCILVSLLRKSDISRSFLFLIASFYIFYVSIRYFGLGRSAVNSLKDGLHYWGTYQGMLSLLAVFSIYMILRGILGKGLGIVIYSFIYIIVFIGNMIEMLYHETFVKPIDVFSIGELKGIIGNYLSPVLVIAIISVFAALVFVVVYLRKWIGKCLRPDSSSVMIVSGITIMLWLFTGLYENVYEDLGINIQNTWSADQTKIKDEGFVAFTYSGLLHVMNIFPEAPEGYSKKLVDGILRDYKLDGTAGTELTDTNRNAQTDTEIDTELDTDRPDVIYVMLESIFDPDELNQYGISYSEDPDPVMDQYKLTTTITPTYGGYTSRSEFEGLTGLSDSFFPYGTVEYTTFFGSTPKPVYSIAEAFKEKGYYTTAIHQNKRSFYNRNTVYESMGFDQFIAKGDYEFTKEDQNNDSYLTNSHFLGLIEKQLESSEQPQFIWGITIESHAPYQYKYLNTDIEVSGGDLSDAAKKELTQYIQSIKKTDEFIGQLIEYAKNRKRPTLLVFFGDHLPNMLCVREKGLTGDVHQMFGTVCVGYANYMELEIPEEYLSTNYLPEFVVHSAGIHDNAFFNYLGSLRQKKPDVHIFLTTPEEKELLKPYEVLQYDIMFGKKYYKSYVNQ